MPADIIRADYAALHQVVYTFKQESTQVAEFHQALQRALSQLQEGGWMGRNADAFFAEMENKVLPAVRRLIEALAQSHQATQQVAQTLHTADQQAAQQFKKSINADSASQNGMSLPRNGLQAMTNTLHDHLQRTINTLAVPPNWLAGVLEAFQGSSNTTTQQTPSVQAADSAMHGGGSGGGAAGPAATPLTNSQGVGSGSIPHTTAGDPSLSSALPHSYSSGGSTMLSAPTGSNAPGKFSYHSSAGAAAGVGGSAHNSATNTASAFAPATMLSGAPEGANKMGLPIGIALASPFIHLFGKAIKDKLDND